MRGIFDNDEPDPGTVEDERCTICGANDDEPCETTCTCTWCLMHRRIDTTTDGKDAA